MQTLRRARTFLQALLQKDVSARGHEELGSGQSSRHFGSLRRLLVQQGLLQLATV